MSNIVKDELGTYRWAFEYHLMRNPIIFITILKIFFWICVGMGAFMVILAIPDLMQGYSTPADMLGILGTAGIMFLIMAILSVVGYAVYAAMQGGKYCVLFTMDEMGIEHRQFDKQVQKAQVVGLVNILAGLVGHNITQVGIGLTSARSTMTSDFSAVKSIRGYRRWGVIKVNEPLAKNQVYVEPGDYDFVFDYIVSHCPNATKVKG